MVYLADCGHPSGCDMVSNCGFDFHFPEGQARELLIFLSVYYMPSLEPFGRNPHREGGMRNQKKAW